MRCFGTAPPDDNEFLCVYRRLHSINQICLAANILQDAAFVGPKRPLTQDCRPEGATTAPLDESSRGSWGLPAGYCVEVLVHFRPLCKKADAHRTAQGYGNASEPS